MITLTKRQALALDYIERQPIPPTLREIGEHMGIGSTNGVNDHVRALWKKKRIEKFGMKSRGIRVISPLTEEERKCYGLEEIRIETGRCPTCGHEVSAAS